MMNKNPDREVKAALAAGKKPGTTDVILTPTTRFPMHATYSWDNEGVLSSGKKRLGYGLRYNNLFGLDDTFIGGASVGRSFGGTYFYHTLPVNFEGTSIMYGYSRSWSKPLGDYAGTGLKSEAVNSNISLRQDLYRKDEYVGEVFLGFDSKDKVIKTSTQLINRDRQRMFSIGANLVDRRVGSSTYISPEFEQGVSAFGATTHNNVFASRNAYPVFSKFNLSVQHKRALPYNLQANLKFKSQVTSRKLVPQEQFGLGGIDSVRGYPASDYLADNALNTSAEILIPAFFIPQDWKIPYAEDTLKNQTTALGFVDYGWGMRRGALPTEKGKINLLGIGAGVRFSLFNQALLRLEWGFPVGANNPETEGGRGRFHFAVDVQEKTPEEIERIRKLVEEEHIKQWAWKLVNEELSRPLSPIRKKIDGLMQLAHTAGEKNKQEEVRIIKQKISSLQASLYRQAEEYVRGCILQEKELREYRKLAEVSYKEGDIDKAKQLWQKIVVEAKPKPLILEF
jgi:hemolysin activation/secretion protein